MINEVVQASTMESTLFVGGYTSLKATECKNRQLDSPLYVNETTQLKGAVSMNDKLEVVQAY